MHYLYYWLLHHYWHNVKTRKMPKKWPSLKNRGLVPTIQPEPDSSWTCRFHLVLDNVKLIMYMKFQKLLMTGLSMDQKHQKCLKNGGFPPFVNPKIFFFKNPALSLLYLYGVLTSYKKLEKNNSQSLRYLKTDHRPTDQQTRAIPKDPLGRTWGPKL